MPSFTLPIFAAQLHRLNPNCQVVQIGAMDGKSNDPLFPLLQKYAWRALIVEPLPDQFALLSANYAANPKVILENCAITESGGRQIMYRLPRRLVEEEHWPAWALGASSFFRDRNALAWESVRQHIVEEEVASLTFGELIQKHPLQRVDFLQIDAEGYDFKILKQLPWHRFTPMIVHLEIVNLPKDEVAWTKQLLNHHRYLHLKSGYNLLAIHPTLLCALGNELKSCANGGGGAENT